MALSEEDWKLLEQMEKDLSGDEHLADLNMMAPRSSGGAKKKHAPRRVAAGAVLAVTGMTISLLGISLAHLWIAVLAGVVGFTFMVVGLLLAAIPTVEADRIETAMGRDRRVSRGPSFMDRQQDKWDQRHR